MENIAKQIQVSYETTSEDLSVDSLLLLSENNKIDTELACQRNDVWKPEQQQGLVDTLVRQERIPEIHAIVEPYGRVYKIIDGKQRLNTILAFVQDHFSWKKKEADKDLHFIFGDKTTLLFSEMPLEIQNIILSNTIHIVKYSNITDRGLGKLFCKLNNGKPLSKYQKGIANNIFYRQNFGIYIESHPAVKELFSPAMIRDNKVEQNFLGILTLMLAADENYGDFCAADIYDDKLFFPDNKYFPSIDDMSDNQILEWKKVLKEKADYLCDALSVLQEYSCYWDKKKTYRGQVIYPFIIKYVKHLSEKEFIQVYEDFFDFSTSHTIDGGAQPFNKKGVQKAFDYIEKKYKF